VYNNDINNNAQHEEDIIIHVVGLTGRKKESKVVYASYPSSSLSPSEVNAFVCVSFLL
jgi:hypothetical protein